MQLQVTAPRHLPVKNIIPLPFRQRTGALKKEHRADF